mmetsp:Transcript_29598/g.63428  ORF Transcript_29598/g.63428 Transcript_29598/m.63428 type:complete len:289 (-) Transcript_29598:158-1024(-)
MGFAEVSGALFPARDAAVQRRNVFGHFRGQIPGYLEVPLGGVFRCNPVYRDVVHRLPDRRVTAREIVFYHGGRGFGFPRKAQELDVVSDHVRRRGRSFSLHHGKDGVGDLDVSLHVGVVLCLESFLDVPSQGLDDEGVGIRVRGDAVVRHHVEYFHGVLRVAPFGVARHDHVEAFQREQAAVFDRCHLVLSVFGKHPAGLADEEALQPDRRRKTADERPRGFQAVFFHGSHGGKRLLETTPLVRECHDRVLVDKLCRDVPAGLQDVPDQQYQPGGTRLGSPRRYGFQC